MAFVFCWSLVLTQQQLLLVSKLVLLKFKHAVILDEIRNTNMVFASLKSDSTFPTSDASLICLNLLWILKLWRIWLDAHRGLDTSDN